MIITHSGRFHADEVFAIAMIQLIEKHDIIRTRDEDTIATGDIILDVGGIYDPATQRFDHHQNSFTLTRENGIPYATAGIVWQHYGKTIFQKMGLNNDYEINYAIQWVDNKLIADIDAVDNGLHSDDPRPSVSLIIAMMNRSHDEDIQYQAFQKAITLTTDIMQNFIDAAIKQAQVIIELETLAKKVTPQGILILEKELPFKDFLRNHPEIKRVVYPKGEEGFGIYCNEKINHLPEKFRGLRATELNQISGLTDTIFCHKSGFMAICKSQESAIKLANTQQ